MVEDIGEKKEKKLEDLRSENEALKIEVAKLNQGFDAKNTQMTQLEGKKYYFLRSMHFFQKCTKKTPIFFADIWCKNENGTFLHRLFYRGVYKILPSII